MDAVDLVPSEKNYQKICRLLITALLVLIQRLHELIEFKSKVE